MTQPGRRLSTGVDGLDTILDGGLIAERSYMIRGPAGSGKTILGFHFLSAGLAAGEDVLFVNLEEDLGDLRTNAEALGFDTGAIEFLDLSPGADVFAADKSYDVFPASDVEQEPVTEAIVEAVRTHEPDRVVVDPLTQLRYLTNGEYQFRKQVVGFMRFLKGQGATVLFTTQERDGRSTADLQFMCDGTISLSETASGRQIAVPKFRGSATQSGTHTYRITDAGMVVFPALNPGKRRAEFTREQVSSGIDEIDSLLTGGIERGTVTVISGPTGVGKTTLGTQFMKEAAERGERSVIYLFEENERTFLTRSEAIGIPVEAMIEQGTLRVEEIEALEQSPQEFASTVRTEVEDNDTQMVMLDGIAGYRLTLRGAEDTITQHLHALGRYLQNNGVTAFFVDETSDLIGEFHATEEQISYLADNIILLRYLEHEGELKKSIGVLKQRTSDFERTLRRYEITESGVSVGGPYTDLRGILTGTPEQLE